MREHIPDEILALIADKFRMLSEPTRLSILRTLMVKGEQNVGQVVKLTGGSQANVSKHLKQLAASGLIARRKEGLNVLYRLDDPVVEKICELVCDSLRRDLEAEIKRNATFLRKGQPK